MSFARAGFILMTGLSVACEPVPPAECQVFESDLAIRNDSGQTADVFGPGESLVFEYLLQNSGSTAVTLSAGSPCTSVVFEVIDDTDARRWSSIDDIGCIETLQPRTFASGEQASESVSWDLRGSDGERLPPGEYVVHALSGQYSGETPEQLVDCRNELSKSASFLVR